MTTTIRWVIRLIGLARPLAAGAVTLLDLALQTGPPRYIKSYDRSAADGRGVLTTTPDRAAAQTFESVAAAMAYWKQDHGRRPDGQPNRPLTAYTVSIESVR